LIELVYDKKSYVIPENWNELTTKQVVNMVRLIHASKDDVDFLYRALQILLQMSNWDYVKLSNDFKGRAFDHIIWIAGENTLTKNPFPQLSIVPFFSTLYGPKDDFDNIRAKEFHFAEMSYVAYLETNDIGYLDRLIGVLYRKHCGLKGDELLKRGDVREDFNDNLVPKYANTVLRLSIDTKRAILQWYDGCRHNLLQSFKSLKKADGVQSDDFKGLYPLMHSMAGEKYGDFDKIEQKLVWDLMYAMQQFNDDAKEQEKLAKKQKS